MFGVHAYECLGLMSNYLVLIADHLGFDELKYKFIEGANLRIGDYDAKLENAKQYREFSIKNPEYKEKFNGMIYRMIKVMHGYCEEADIIKQYEEMIFPEV